jgi:transposase-like protein
MYNNKIYCNKCKNFNQKYDSTRSIFNFDKYVYCPICKAKLIKEPYAPDI